MGWSNKYKCLRGMWFLVAPVEWLDASIYLIGRHTTLLSFYSSTYCQTKVIFLPAAISACPTKVSLFHHLELHYTCSQVHSLAENIDHQTDPQTHRVNQSEQQDRQTDRKTGRNYSTSQFHIKHCSCWWEPAGLKLWVCVSASLSVLPVSVRRHQLTLYCFLFVYMCVCVCVMSRSSM